MEAHGPQSGPRQSSKRKKATVAELTKAFVERSPGKPATIKVFQQTLDSLVVFFGADTRIESIIAERADEWRFWVVKDKKGSGRRNKQRTTDDNRLAAPTVAKRISVAKQVFRCAVRGGWLKKSPFDGLQPGLQANPARVRYIPLATICDPAEPSVSGAGQAVPVSCSAGDRRPDQSDYADSGIVEEGRGGPTQPPAPSRDTRAPVELPPAGHSTTKGLQRV